MESCQGLRNMKLLDCDKMAFFKGGYNKKYVQEQKENVPFFTLLRSVYLKHDMQLGTREGFDMVHFRSHHDSIFA